MSLILRAMAPLDADDVSRLLPDLGYTATPDQVARRLAALREWPQQDVFVALLDDALVGLCHVQGVRLLASDGYVEIQALVVSAACQGRGIGKALMAHATAWACELGYERMRLRSGTHRVEAHEFYGALGFDKSRASFAFEKALLR